MIKSVCRGVLFFFMALFWVSTQFALRAEGALPVCMSPVSVNRTIIGFVGHEWIVIGDRNGGVYPASNNLTLLLKNDDAGGGFGSIEFENAKGLRENNSLRLAMKAIVNQFSNEERVLIDTRNLLAGRDDVTGADSGYYSMWPLSLQEWGTIDDKAVRAFNDYWRLRSQYDVSFAGDSSGLSGGSLVGIPASCTIRPAFSLNLSTVIFTPSAHDVFPDNVNSTVTAERPAANMLKLTVLEDVPDKLDLLVNDRSGRVARSGIDDLVIVYAGAKTGSGKTITAVIADGRNSVQMLYSRADCVSDEKAKGVFRLATPDSSVLPGGSYKLFILNEQLNGDNVTNRGSSPIEIPLTIDDGMSPSVTSFTPADVYSTTEWFELTFSEMVRLIEGKAITITADGDVYTYTIKGGELMDVVPGHSTAKISFRNFKNSSNVPLALKLGVHCTVAIESGAFTDMSGNQMDGNVKIAVFEVTEPVIFY
jgi:hypothetical protein